MSEPCLFLVARPGKYWAHSVNNAAYAYGWAKSPITKTKFDNIVSWLA